MDIEKWIEDIIGYCVGFCGWLITKFPGSCDEWISFLSLLTVLITLLFITIPKAFYGKSFPQIAREWKKKRG